MLFNNNNNSKKKSFNPFAGNDEIAESVPNETQETELPRVENEFKITSYIEDLSEHHKD